MKWLLVLASLVLLSNVVYGAVIEGSVYYLSLELVPNSIVEINTTPKQKMVAVDGDYHFEVHPGLYTIRAFQSELQEIEENITVDKEGNFVFDLILLPIIDEESDVFLDEDVPEIDDLIQDSPASLFQWLAWLVIFVILGYVVYRISKQPGNAEVKQVAVGKDLDKIMTLIEEHDGRVSQKELRKHMPYSEAKISLMVTELENKGLISRIKKGRSNIIIKK